MDTPISSSSAADAVARKQFYDLDKDINLIFSNYLKYTMNLSVATIKGFKDWLKILFGSSDIYSYWTNTLEPLFDAATVKILDESGTTIEETTDANYFAAVANSGIFSTAAGDIIKEVYSVRFRGIDC